MPTYAPRPILFIAAAAFAAALLSLTACTAAGSIGSIAVNGEGAQMAYAQLVGMKPVDGVPRMVLVIGEKVPGPGVDPGAAADAGGLGVALTAPVLKYENDAWSLPTGCIYVHPAAKRGRGWVDGETCALTDVVEKDGTLRARIVSTRPARDASKDAVTLDITLQLKMP